MTAGDVLCDVETDKATMAWENQDDGWVARLLKDAGAKVRAQSVMRGCNGCDAQHGQHCSEAATYKMCITFRQTCMTLRHAGHSGGHTRADFGGGRGAHRGLQRLPARQHRRLIRAASRGGFQQQPGCWIRSALHQQAKRQCVTLDKCFGKDRLAHVCTSEVCRCISATSVSCVLTQRTSSNSNGNSNRRTESRPARKWALQRASCWRVPACQQTMCSRLVLGASSLRCMAEIIEM